LSVFIELVPALLASRGSLGISPESQTCLELLTSHTDRPTPPMDVRDNTTRSELLLTALRDLVDAVTTELPLIICVEDAHWADCDSLKELLRIIHSATERTLLVVCTSRTPETFPTYVSGDRVFTCRLRAFPTAVMVAMAQQLLPVVTKHHRDHLARWCADTAAGNPFFLQMLCGHYAVTGQAYSVPADMRSAVEERFRQLSSTCRRVVEAIAMLGRHANLETVLQWSPAPKSDLFDAIRALEECNFITQSDGVLQAHALLCEQATAGLPPITKQLLHRSVAEALEARYLADRNASVLWDCAEHWLHSGEKTKAVDFIVRCAQHMMNIGQAADALRILSRADPLADSPSALSGILECLVVAAKASGNWPLALEHSRRIKALRRTGEGEVHTQLEFIELEAQWLCALDGTSQIPRLWNCVRDGSASTQHRIDAAQLLSRIAHETAHEALAHEVFTTVVPLLTGAEKNYTSRTLPSTYHTLFGDQHLALELVRSISRDRHQFDSLLDRLRSALNCSGNLIFLGQALDAIDLANQGYRESESLGLVSWEIEFAVHICTAYCMLEDHAHAEEWADRASVLRTETTLPLARVRHTANLVEIAILKGNGTDALQLLGSVSSSSLGDSVRGRAFFRSSEIRARQLDPHFQTDDAMIDELRELHQRTKRLT
jgi:hypothetical protein